MSELILGMGEVGNALYDLLTERKLTVNGIDIDLDKCKTNNGHEIVNAAMMHVCLPYNDDFIKNVIDFTLQYKPAIIIIHSTVPVDTCSRISKQLEGRTPLFYSPIRGVHERFLQDLKRYEKFIAPHLPAFEDEMILRFGEIAWCESVSSLELAKIMETTYYGFLIAFRKDVDERFSEMKLDSEVFWEFCLEVHQHLGNRPVMYSDGEKIGGHCVIPNLDLLPPEFDFYKEWIGKWGK